MTENTGFLTYQLYSALKLHFTSSYDFFKYHGKTNTTKESFLRRKDRYQFYKLSRKYNLEELENFIVANMLVSDGNWVGDLLTPEAEAIYKQWQKVSQSLAYTFKSEVNKIFDIVESPDDLLKVDDGQYPLLLKLVMDKTISMETLVIMNDIMGFLPLWMKMISDDVVWPQWYQKFMKYAPFMKYDKDTYKNILRDMVKEKV